MKKGWIVILALIVILGFWGCNKYNGLQTANLNVNNAWGSVETNYQRRSDLYQNMVQTIKGSAKFEDSTLIGVVNARANATKIQVNIEDTASLAKFQAAQAQLQSSFSKLLAVSEQYPDLKTTSQFQNLETEIEGTENRINIARKDYNQAVTDYNTKVQLFPGNIFANLFGFKPKALFQAAAGTENAPNIQF
ncbi:LemA family protein [Arachidicoccus ginsenosidimutans]|uniref:LemA family protein n=1 Tax=Arachidicoccus sp. BS20 TaxID=1850526 RepID=UPI0007F0D819|nr:LemA family protein [Arachidicoccus sp. BS20]ANI90666.1 LemA family protein [Arachidicoccus sp. BS20]